MTRDGDPGRRREVAIEAARAAAEIHLRYRGQQLRRDAHAGERADYSTRADIEAEQAVRAVVARHYPEDVVIGEEDNDRYSEVESLLESGCWFTDPLDGTADYAHGSPDFSAVVSYVEAGEPQACAVYFPALSEMYTATRGFGATLNDTPARVSGVAQLRDAVLAMPFRSTEPARAKMLAQQMQHVLPHIEAIRLPGPPSLMACSVASGRYDVFTMMGGDSRGAACRPPVLRATLGDGRFCVTGTGSRWRC